jgi:hypothetical protein
MQLFQNDSDVTLIIERVGEPMGRILLHPGENLSIGLDKSEWNLLKIDPPIRITGIYYKTEPKKIVDTGLSTSESNPDAGQS